MLTVFFRLFFGYYYYRRHYNIIHTPKKSEFIYSYSTECFVCLIQTNKTSFQTVMFFRSCLHHPGFFREEKITEKKNFLLHNRGIINTFFLEKFECFFVSLLEQQKHAYFNFIDLVMFILGCLDCNDKSN